MHRSLIVAKVLPSAEREVAQIFADSDRTDLPRVAGVRHRSLYRLDDLYVHLMETFDDTAGTLSAVREHPEFARVSERLQPYISPYLPTWRSAQDAVAHCFYSFDAPVVSERGRR